MKPIDVLIKSVAARQRSLTGVEVLAPRLSRNERLAIRVDGLVYSYHMTLGGEPEDAGEFINPLRWWRVVDTEHAVFEREATAIDIAGYLGRLPRVRVVYVGGEIQLAFIANAGGTYGFDANQPLSVHFLHGPEDPRVRGLVRFTTLDTRFDGTRLWADRIVKDRVDTTRFESAITQAISPGPPLLYGDGSRRRVKGAQPGHYVAAQFAYDRLEQVRRQDAADRERNRELTVRERIDAALSFSGGVLRTYEDRGQNHIRVTYHVGGRTYRSTVRDDMSVVTAGFCTAGHDADHDLTTLVDLIRYGQDIGHYAVE